MLYFAFGIAPGMFPADCAIIRRTITPEDARGMIEAAGAAGDLGVALNPSHAATIGVMHERFGIDVPIPPRAPMVQADFGDAVLVMGVSGLPRLEGRHEYTPEEVKRAVFTFSTFSVEEIPFDGRGE